MQFQRFLGFVKEYGYHVFSEYETKYHFYLRILSLNNHFEYYFCQYIQPVVYHNIEEESKMNRIKKIIGEKDNLGRRYIIFLIGLFICSFVGINAVFEMIASTLVSGLVGVALFKSGLVRINTEKVAA